MKKNFCAVLSAAFAALLLLSGCADSPETLAKKDFEKRKTFSGKDLKEKIFADIETERQAVYASFLESDGEEIAKEEADLAAEELRQKYEDWTDEDYENQAASDRKWLAGASLAIDKVMITSNAAIVNGTARLRSGATLTMEWLFIKSDDGSWVLRPQRDDEAENAE